MSCLSYRDSCLDGNHRQKRALLSEPTGPEPESRAWHFLTVTLAKLVITLSIHFFILD